jgi:hypothetical protein
MVHANWCRDVMSHVSMSGSCRQYQTCYQCQWTGIERRFAFIFLNELDWTKCRVTLFLQLLLCTLYLTNFFFSKGNILLWHGREGKINARNVLVGKPEERRSFRHRGAQIPGAKSPWRLNFVRWSLIFAGSQYGTRFMSLFWRIEFWDGF